MFKALKIIFFFFFSLDNFPFPYPFFTESVLEREVFQGVLRPWKTTVFHALQPYLAWFTMDMFQRSYIWLKNVVRVGNSQDPEVLSLLELQARKCSKESVFSTDFPLEWVFSIKSVLTGHSSKFCYFAIKLCVHFQHLFDWKYSFKREISAYNRHLGASLGL